MIVVSGTSMLSCKQGKRTSIAGMDVVLVSLLVTSTSRTHPKRSLV